MHKKDGMARPTLTRKGRRSYSPDVAGAQTIAVGLGSWGERAGFELGLAERVALNGLVG